MKTKMTSGTNLVRVRNSRSRSSKVNDSSTNHKCIYSFQLVTSNNLGLFHRSDTLNGTKSSTNPMKVSLEVPFQM